jgi:hypothetical protein
MRTSLQVAVQLSSTLVAAVVLGQAAPPVVPAPTPTPAAVEAAPSGVRLAAPSPESGQRLSESMPVNPGVVVQTGSPGEAEKKPSKSELVIAPIPMLDPAVGYGLGVSAVYTFPKKKTENPPPPTTLGGGGFYTSNHTWGVGAGAQLYLKEGRYRLAFAGSVGRFNYDLYPAGSGGKSFAISQNYQHAVGQFMVGLGKRWYAGVRAVYASSDVSLQDADVEPGPIVQDLLESKLVEIGLRVERDSRDSTFYPTAGSHFDLVAYHDDPSYGSDFTFTRPG